jgi:uncharacterized protein (DUF1499 family)
MWLRLLAITLALTSAVLLLGSGAGVHAGLWSFQVGFAILRWAAYTGLACAAAALVALALPKVRGKWGGGLVAALTVGIAAAFVPWHFQQRARAVPPIHDISTDLDQPPAFFAVLPLRIHAPNAAAYPGNETAEQQRKGYPDIQPLTLPLPASVAFSRALDAAEAMGWKIVGSNPAAGRIEATATTFWFGFKDDVVVRITPVGNASRIDVRSVSRVGRSDAGTNAARIREYLAILRR